MTKIIEYTIDSEIYKIQLQLQSINNFTDEMIIEMNQIDDETQKFCGKVKVFKNKEGIESLKSIESIEKKENDFNIKFIFGNVVTETLLSRDSQQNEKERKYSLFDDFELKFQNQNQQIIELKNTLKNLIMSIDELQSKMNEKNEMNEDKNESEIKIIEEVTEMKEEIEEKQKDKDEKDEIIQKLIKRIEECEEKCTKMNDLEMSIHQLTERIESLEKLSQEKSEGFIDLDDEIMENKPIENTELKNEIETIQKVQINESPSSNETKGLNESLQSKNTESMESSQSVMNSSFNSVSSTISIVSLSESNEYMKNEIDNIKNWMSETTEVIKQLQADSTMLKNSEKQREVDSEKDKEKEKYKENKKEKEKDIDKKKETNKEEKDKDKKKEKEQETDLNVEISPISPRKKVSKQKCKSREDLRGEGRIGEPGKRKKEIHTLKALSMKPIAEVEDSNESLLLSSRRLRPSGGIMKKEDLEKHIKEQQSKREQRKKQEKLSWMEDGNSNIFKKLQESEILSYVITDETNETLINMKNWIDENTEIKDFWKIIHEERPHAVMIFSDSKSNGIEMNERIQMFYDDMEVVMFGFEDIQLEDEIQYVHLENEMNDNNKELVKKIIKQLK